MDDDTEAMKRNTPMKRGKPMARKRMKRKPPPQGFPEQVRMAVKQRSGGRCEARTRHCSGIARHLHHRKLRTHGDHREVTALHVCQACHVEIHSCGELAYLMGWLVHSWDDPAVIPLRRGEGKA